MTKTIVGLLLGMLIGVGCRWFDVPVPSPPRLLGALLVLAITVGYVAADKFLGPKAEERSAAVGLISHPRSPAKP